ncbi:MAG: methionyl-tRNA formyltransferase [Peptoniphilaceae bacterium]|nr:methionyl-tRNA formyltransferase [Peptoniphilaceae bacterium]
MMTKINICFMGNPKFALSTLDVLNKEEKIDIKLVVTGKDKKRSRNKITPSPVKEYAVENGLNYVTPDSVNNKEFIDSLKALDIDFIVVVAFGQLIGQTLLDEFNDRIINLHPSLLPKYRGAAPIQFTLLNGEKYTAPTTMLIEKAMDAGDILIQDKIKVEEDDDFFTLSEKLTEKGAYAIRDTLLNFEQVYKNRIKQDNNKATFTKKITKEMGKINWNDDMETIHNQVRALVAFPKAYLTYHGIDVKVLEVKKHPYDQAKPSYVYRANANDNILVGCKDGAIEITKIQFPGKKAMDTKSFLLGNEFKENIYLDE